MTIELTCDCGRRFQAPDRLAGRTINCAGCGRSLKIRGANASQAESSSSKTAPAPSQTISRPTISVRCRCGQNFMAPPELAGKWARCRACGEPVGIPAHAPVPRYEPVVEPVPAALPELALLTYAVSESAPGRLPPLPKAARLPPPEPPSAPAARRRSSSRVLGNPLLLPGIFLLILSLSVVVLIGASAPRRIILLITLLQAIDMLTPYETGRLIGEIVSLVLVPLVNLAIAMGAISMIRLTNYDSAHRAAVLSIIPVCSPFCMVGIPFGLWAMFVLNRSDVKRRFSYR